ncbi:hypothetical protein TCON_2170 [Astathelohania contejeani]|uniref:Uncharacterized protein n=1 Tax=Astathelohania contejeani TaxID=164912 RepID=A0ABQ7HWS6_9MICR|nr:hypothetical protein TCON_2170 [Thelohania contejeani]
MLIFFLNYILAGSFTSESGNLSLSNYSSLYERKHNICKPKKNWFGCHPNKRMNYKCGTSSRSDCNPCKPCISDCSNSSSFRSDDSSCDDRLRGILRCLFHNGSSETRTAVLRFGHKLSAEIKEVSNDTQRCLLDKINKEFAELYEKVRKIFNHHHDKEDFYFNPNGPNGSFNTSIKNLLDQKLSSLDSNIRSMLINNHSELTKGDATSLKNEILVTTKNEFNNLFNSINQLVKSSLESNSLKWASKDENGNEKHKVLQAIRETERNIEAIVRTMLDKQQKILLEKVEGFLCGLIRVLTKIWLRIEKEVVCVVKKFCCPIKPRKCYPVKRKYNCGQRRGTSQFNIPF